MPDPRPFDALVVTSIASPNPVLRELAAGALSRGVRFIVVGDSKSPADFELDGCEFWSLARQRELPFRLAAQIPERSYARKNLGYLLAIQGGATSMVETDDDNFPKASFWNVRSRAIRGRTLPIPGWINAYAWFADTFIYPRGFPLEAARAGGVPAGVEAPTSEAECPVQQGLADENPDVDAVYRMLFPLPFSFRQGDAPLILSAGQWCPFNSQNTTFFKEVFPLLYLPAHCSFRMTDIWRSFVAQRILWANRLSVAFHAATVRQERNVHDLRCDFEQEIPGYLHNTAMVRALEAVEVPAGLDRVPEAMRRCYDRLIAGGWIGADETALLDAWLGDLEEIEGGRVVGQGFPTR